LRNAPDVHGSRRGLGFPVLLITGAVFGKVDKEPGRRQLYQIAELGKLPGESTRCPDFMRLLVAAEQPRIPGDSLDFRDEIMAQIFDRGDAVPKRSLSLTIEVTDESSAKGPAIAQHRTFSEWRRIGRLTFDNAVVSYNGDFVIHFNHPTWRDDRNDPATAIEEVNLGVKGANYGWPMCGRGYPPLYSGRKDHILEMGRELPRYPTLFAKYTEALIGAHDSIVLPRVSDAVDWEVELALVIGQSVRHATAEQAAAAIAGFTVANDISMRDYQYRTLQWDQGKNFEKTSGFGPVLVTDYTLGSRIETRLDGQLMQSATTDDLVLVITHWGACP
jgi:2-keto-4-pentenoate hydratase/2-oxohepta-3-ene-1,7-dioic acid hydratase in catechol pathway